MTTSRERFELVVDSIIKNLMPPARPNDWLRHTFDGEKLNVTVIPREQVYFDSTHLQEAELFKAQCVALEQNELVMAIFRRKRRALTPWEVWQEGAKNGRQWLITSVRRSMSVLSAGEAPALVKLDSLRMGPHGKPSHEWIRPEDRQHG